MSDDKTSMTPEELALWQQMTRDVKPLPEAVYVDVSDKRSDKKQIAESRINKKGREDTFPVPPSMISPKSGSRSSEVDKRTARRLEQGKIPIEARLDLHGLNQDQAHEALIRFVLGSYDRGMRCILVITGTGARRGSEGILKRRVPEWLRMSPLDAVVLQTRKARLHHGGAGALYVYLRRERG